MINGKHFHVLIGLRGCYMPDGNNLCFDLEEAHDVALWHVESERDAGHRVQGSKADGFWAIRDPEGSDYGRGSYGWRSISITACDDFDCHVDDCHVCGEFNTTVEHVKACNA